MKILVTGMAGFIGAHACRKLLEQGHEVIGLDNINTYYDPALKHGRLSALGIEEGEIEWNVETGSRRYPALRFIRLGIENREGMEKLFATHRFDAVLHLAAQAGVRYSIENPYCYVESNVMGFLNILEGCRSQHVSHLVYASSSSVYGLNAGIPFSEQDGIAHPVSLYAATKKADELMAHTYSHLYGIPTTGLRFFTVYGPWGRPDMSPFLFADAILHNRPIKVFNNGDMWRDFTYIDDIVEGVVRVINRAPAADPEWNAGNPDPSRSSAPYRIYNIGNSRPVRLMDFIEAIEKAIGRPAAKEYLPMQPGDVYQTYADTTALEQEIDFKPSTSIEEGVKKTIAWYRDFYHI